MREKHQTAGLKAHQEHNLRLKTYISSKYSLWFWISLAFIFLFFVFSWITSENILILFIKRTTTLIFAFLIPGYVITKAIYPRKKEINAIEELALSIGFSITFIIFISYFLNIVWTITHFSLAITTFLFALIFAFIALLRMHGKDPITKKIKKLSIKDAIVPLSIIGAVAFILNSYDPLTSPILGASDPYGWTYRVNGIIQSGSIPHVLFLGYPWGFALFTAFLTIFLDISAYDTMRYIPIFPFLNVIPTYLLTYHIFRSVRVSLLAAVFIMSTKFIFQYASIAVPQMMIHFLFILFLFMLLKTLEDTSIKNIFATSLILSSNILLYHFEMIILILFLPLIFIVIAVHNRIQKKSNRELLKCVSLLGLSSTLITGSLWYFWQLGPILKHYSKQYTSYDVAKVATSFQQPKFYMYIVHDGWVLTLLSVIGLLFILSKPKHLKEIRYQFLIAYLVTTLFIIEFFIPIAIPRMQFLTAGNSSIFNTSSYFFSYLTLPLAMLASYGLFNVLSRIHKNIKTQPMGKLFAFIIIVSFILNVSSLNYQYPPKKVTTELDKKLDQRDYNSLFFSNYYWIKPLTKHEYVAFEWINENTPLSSIVTYWYTNTYGQRICDCDAISISKLNISNSTSTEIMKKTYRWHSRGINVYVLTGLLHSRRPVRLMPFARGRLDFSNKTLESIAADPHFRLVYENPQIKIYRIESDNYTVSLDKQGGFRDDFTSPLYWGNNLNEKNTLSTKKGIATYRSVTEYQPIDILFSSGVDTKIYPYFETRMKVVDGKISVGVYDSKGAAHMFLKDYTTNGKWERYKFNLNSWLAQNGYEDAVYGIIITDTLDGAKSFRSQIDWISIHNHIFGDLFDGERRIASKVNVTIGGGGATLSKTTAELLSNNGFEDDFKGWIPHAKWGIDNEESHSGNKSAVLYGTVDPAHDASAYLDTAVYRGVLKPNTSYRFSVWIKGDVTDAVKGPIRQFGSVDLWSKWVSFTQDNKKYSDWTYSERVITMPDDINGDFLIRIYGGGNPEVWIDDISFRADTYVSSGKLTSITTNTKNPIVSLTPSWTSTEADGRSITIEVSVDNGATWTVAKNGVSINYPASDANRHLMYRAYLQTDDVYTSPVLQDITLTYGEEPDNR